MFGSSVRDGDRRRPRLSRRAALAPASVLATIATAAAVPVPSASATGATESLATLQAAVNAASPGATVALTGDVTGATGSGLMIPSGENLTLDLAGYTLSVNATGGSTAAIDVPASSGLTIEDSSSGQTGSLHATGAYNCAGIGDCHLSSEGNITIASGTVDATSSSDAGIGGGSPTAVITITGGTVTATGGAESAGIGGDDGSLAGVINISGGSVTATGGDYAAGIGSGYDAYATGNITISGGTVVATGGGGGTDEGGAGIGGGLDSGGSSASNGTITISSGMVTATGGEGAPGIGNATSSGPNFSVALSGGTIAATGGTDAPGIGAGTGNAGGPVPLTVAAKPLGSTGTDGGASTSANGATSLASTITDDPGAAIYYTADDVPGPGGAVTVTFYYPVSFDLDGHGSAVATQNVAYGTEVSEPTAPTASGYMFGGWYGDSALTNAFNFSTAITPTAPLTLYAKWTVTPLTATTPTTATTTATAPASTPTTVATPTPTPPKPPAKVVNPTIRAHLHSATRPSHGWYRSAVRISFTCKRGSAALSRRCPKAVTLSRNGADQKLKRTIRARDGGHATITVRGISIDRTAPRVSVVGVRANATYIGASVPAAHCKASDRLSGVQSCSLDVRREGAVVVYLARATGRAGESAGARVAIRLSPFSLSGVIPSLGAYSVHRQDTYTFYVVAATQPRYVDAAPWPRRPAGSSVLFRRDGSTDSLPLWKVRVTIDTPAGNSSRWNLGYLVGGTLHSATVTVEP